MRRHKVKNSQLLELQSTLQDEIQLRHQITGELTEERQNSQRLEMENDELKQKLAEFMANGNYDDQNKYDMSSGGRSASPVNSLGHSSLELRVKLTECFIVYYK